MGETPNPFPYPEKIVNAYQLFVQKEILVSQLLLEGNAEEARKIRDAAIESVTDQLSPEEQRQFVRFTEIATRTLLASGKETARAQIRMMGFNDEESNRILAGLEALAEEITKIADL